MEYSELLIEDIACVLDGLIDAEALPGIDDKPYIHGVEITKGNNVDFLNFTFAIPNPEDAINVVVELENGQFQLRVDDCEEKETGEYALPGLKTYLQQHPSLQYEDVIPKCEMNYYIYKNIPEEYCKVATVAVALAVQEYISRNCN